ncbi:hypothetical protein [Coleofasciculus sp. F4-SAH-05]|uniref:hypothetical protein n=1 Tax=Coleofasciculus sp. F4-SAH-05 TaxID=3069525 RepID=UPI0032F9A60E
MIFSLNWYLVRALALNYVGFNGVAVVRALAYQRKSVNPLERNQNRVSLDVACFL